MVRENQILEVMVNREDFLKQLVIGVTARTMIVPTGLQLETIIRDGCISWDRIQKTRYNPTK